MLRWLKSKAAGSFIKSDTEKTLRAIQEMTAITQRMIALEVVGEVSSAIREIEKTAGPSSPERDIVIKNQLVRAQARRHQALAEGATTHADPGWATASLIEGWMMANSGTIDRHAFDQVNNHIMGWARSVLTDADLEKISTENTT